MKKLLLTLSFVCCILGISAKEYPDYCGKVSCDGTGLPGVVVSDGTDCVVTDSTGNFRIDGKPGVRFIFISTPAGYLTECENSIPKFYQKVTDNNSTYNFELSKNPIGDNHHIFSVQADVQVTSEKDIKNYGKFLVDLIDFNKSLSGKCDYFGIDCGDIVGDCPHLFPSYIKKAATTNMPIYRAKGNHDMTYGGRTYEYSYTKFEELFGPIYYSFNKGKAHYIVLDNCFYVNRDYQYIGYIDERTFTWLEKDLKYVEKGSPVFVVAHIPISLTKKLKWNTLISDETSNAQGLYNLLKDFDAHIITGHTHFNLNVCNADNIMEHNTAAVCGIWWKADICMDGTPVGYGVFNVNGKDVKWYYNSYGFDKNHQMRAYPVGTDSEYPDDIIANVWNWDEKWKIEWLEDGKTMGKMTQYTGYDPMAKEICSDKKKVEYDWISPVKNGHMFRATPKNPNAKIEIKATDRFGNIYTQKIN